MDDSQQQHHHLLSPQANTPFADHAESDGDEDQYFSGDDDGVAANANGETSRKRRRHPVSVSSNVIEASHHAVGVREMALFAGYGRELEQRLDRLEEVLQKHSRILEAGFSENRCNNLSAEQNTLQDGQMLPSNGHADQIARAEAGLFLQEPPRFPPAASKDYATPLPPHTTSIQSMRGDLFPPSVSIDSMQPNIHQTHPLQNNVQANRAFYHPNQPPVESNSLNITQSEPDLSSDQALPPYDLLYALVDLYFKYVNMWCPILHRRSTLDSLFGPANLEEADRILLHAIVATTLRFSADVRLTEDRRKHYHDVSKQKVLLYGLENSSVKALQALVILALDLVGSSNGPPGWNLLALITRSVVQLGLSVETSSYSVSPNYPSIYTLRAMVLPEPKTWIEEESRRRLFWMIYLLDRYATIATAFEFALDEKEIDRKLPCRDDLWNKNQKVDTRWFRTTERTEYDIDKPENLGAFSYYIEILGILSRIHRFLKKPVDISALSDVEKWQGEYRELDNMLTSWKFGLPAEYGNMAKVFQPNGSKTISCGWVMLHATYHTAVVRLHSSAAYPTTRSPIFTPSFSASQRCHGAVENIAALGEYVVKNAMLPKLGPPFAFTLWVAARLLLVHGSTIEHKLSPQIQLFVDTLGEMGRYWAVAERYTAILQRVLDEHRDSECSLDMNGERFTPSSVKILADMRRCAYDLDFLISRQPRQTGLSRMPSAMPARTPAPNELEYLDVFDFFNVPRLPVSHGVESMVHSTASANENPSVGGHELGGVGHDMGCMSHNGFNITNFMVDASSDWLYKDRS
ncbi:MAG: hypothetical protein M1818_006442 [Claussenomyces sp. TS43310]|nr:MAG: hypothetical protein M1818_006442 [Claussenomyces sp. TS43310]